MLFNIHDSRSFLLVIENGGYDIDIYDDYKSFFNRPTDILQLEIPMSNIFGYKLISVPYTNSDTSKDLIVWYNESKNLYRPLTMNEAQNFLHQLKSNKYFKQTDLPKLEEVNDYEYSEI